MTMALYTASAGESRSSLDLPGAPLRMKSITKPAAFPVLALVLLLLLAATGAHGADTQRGKALYQECKRCHQTGRGARHRIGPHLNDLFGRRAGSLPDFRYSRAMRRAGTAGLVWTEATLDTFLADPRKAVPRSRMSYAGMAADDRADLVAWLRSLSGSRLPAAEPTMTAAEYGLDPRLLTIPGDLEYGAWLASECVTCHHAGGAEQGIPAIAGWPVEDFVITLQAYKHGKRKHQAMQTIARRLSNEEIASLAAYFARPADGP